MGKVAYLFAGQGAQYPGMGQSLYASSKAAKKILDEAEALRPGTLEMCFHGTKEELTKTINTQPCLFAVDWACAEALLEAGVMPSALAGFSLGEVAAFGFAGFLKFADAFSLVIKRAELMQACAEKNPAGMAAVVKLSPEEVIALCEQVDGVWPVNFNSPQQTVVAGYPASLEALGALVAAKKGRAIPLAVGGAFHSPLMDDAAAGMREEIAKYSLTKPECTLYADYTGKPYGEEEAADMLVQQVNHPVRWTEIMAGLADEGIDTFIEVGAGKTLAGLAAKCLPGKTIRNVQDAESLAATITVIREGVKNV